MAVAAKLEARNGERATAKLLGEAGGWRDTIRPFSLRPFLTSSGQTFFIPGAIHTIVWRLAIWIPCVVSAFLLSRLLLHCSFSTYPRLRNHLCRRPEEQHIQKIVGSPARQCWVIDIDSHKICQHARSDDPRFQP